MTSLSAHCGDSPHKNGTTEEPSECPEPINNQKMMTDKSVEEPANVQKLIEKADADVFKDSDDMVETGVVPEKAIPAIQNDDEILPSSGATDPVPNEPEDSKPSVEVAISAEAVTPDHCHTDSSEAAPLAPQVMEESSDDRPADADDELAQIRKELASSDPVKALDEAPAESMEETEPAQKIPPEESVQPKSPQQESIQPEPPQEESIRPESPQQESIQSSNQMEEIAEKDATIEERDDEPMEVDESADTTPNSADGNAEPKPASPEEEVVPKENSLPVTMETEEDKSDPPGGDSVIKDDDTSAPPGADSALKENDSSAEAEYDDITDKSVPAVDQQNVASKADDEKPGQEDIEKSEPEDIEKSEPEDIEKPEPEESEMPEQEKSGKPDQEENEKPEEEESEKSKQEDIEKPEPEDSEMPEQEDIEKPEQKESEKSESEVKRPEEEEVEEPEEEESTKSEREEAEKPQEKSEAAKPEDDEPTARSTEPPTKDDHDVKDKDDAEKADDKEKEAEADEEKKESEEEDEEDEEEERVPLLEQPPETSGRRSRKAVDRFSEADTPEKTKRGSLPLEEGRGAKLADCPVVNGNIGSYPAEQVHALHQVVFGRQGKPHEFRRNLRQFSGFPFHPDEAAYNKKRDSLKKHRVEALRSLSHLLNLDTKGKTRDELAQVVLDFLVEPTPTDTVVDSAKKPSRKSSEGPAKTPQKGGRGSSRRRSAVAEEEKEEDEDEEDEEEEDEDQEEEEVKKTPSRRTPAKRTPAKKPPAKKAPAKRTPARKAPAKKTPAKKAPAKKAPAKKTPAAKPAGRKAPARQASKRKRKEDALSSDEEEVIPPASKRTKTGRAPPRSRR